MSAPSIPSPPTIASISLGTAPFEEPCAQLGSPDYEARAKRECAAFIAQLRRHWAAAQAGRELQAELAIDVVQHDFGSYYDVVVRAPETDAVAMRQALWLDSNIPDYWDPTARKDLALPQEEPSAAAED